MGLRPPLAAADAEKSSTTAGAIKRLADSKTKLILVNSPHNPSATVWTRAEMLKLQDLEKFSSMFVNYDLLARRVVPYSYAYPFAELGAGVLMAAGAPIVPLSLPPLTPIGLLGAGVAMKAVRGP